ncbi:hypothetical protein ACX80O_00455 [Arthrobacter sp. Hz1]
MTLKQFLKDYWSALAILAGIVSLYLGALAIDLVWAFWLVCVASLLWAFVKPSARLIKNVVNRYRNYGKLLRRAATAEVREKLLRIEVKQLQRDLPEEYKKGLEEGASRVVGAQLGQGLEPLPRISSITLIQGCIGFAAHFNAKATPIVGSWFTVEVVGTGESKGAVKVVEVRESEKVALLQCCEEVTPEFWEKLRLRVNEDPDPPRSVRLAVYQLSSSNSNSSLGGK